MASQSIKAGVTKNYLQDILTKSELSHVSKASTEKINKFISSKIGNAPSSSKDRRESTQCNIEDTASELQKQVEELNIELQSSRKKIVSLENEIISIKDVRDSAIDEKNNLAGLLVRNNAEIERYKLEITELSSKLQVAVDIKCEALELNNEIQSKEFVLQQREKRMEEEKLLLNTKISSLTEEIERLTSELQTSSLNNNAKIIHLESKLAEISNELNTANELIFKMGNDNKALSSQVDVFTKSILKEKDIDNVVANYNKELSEKEKVCNMYISLNEEATAKINEMAERIVTLEKLLQESINKYNDLELKTKHILIEKEDLVEQKNKEISTLKCNLELVQQQLVEAESQSIDKALSKLTPDAAVINKLLKSDMSLTQLYSELVKMSDELAQEKENNQQLNNINRKSTQELEKHVLYLQKAKAEQEEMLKNNDKFVATIDELTVERIRLNNEITELSNLCKQHDIEKSRLQNELTDLGRQICFLLSKGSMVEGSKEHNISDVSMNESSMLSEENNSSHVISKTLVTFSDIQELQNNNQKLLSKVRDLTEKNKQLQPSEEQFDKESYLKKIEELNSRILELTDSQNMQTKMVSGLIRQRDTYKKLYNDHIQGKRLELSSIPVTSMDCEEVTEPNTSNYLDESSTEVISLKNNLQKIQKQLDALDKEYKTYKEEKKINEKILSDQVESMRRETCHLTALNSKYCARADFNNERIKQLEASIISYKKQIDLVEEKSEIYNKSNAKYEDALKLLRDEVLDTQKKLSTAEVQVEKYKLECKLKTEHEKRLKNQNEWLSREKHGQDILLSNLELIKVCLERRETEKYIKLETRLKDSVQECDAIKKKWKADEDQLKELEENFKRLTETTNTRLQEERNAASSMRNEILELRQNLANRNKSNEELAKKLKIALRPNDSHNSNKGLEEKLLDKENEIKSLNEELNFYKSNNAEINRKWENINKLLTTINDKQCNFKRDCEKKIREYNRRIQLIQHNSNKLRNKNFTANVMRNEILSSSELSSVPEKCRDELKLARIELQKMTDIVYNAEQKYANEMLLHSEDIQKLTELKEELIMKEKQLKEINALMEDTIKKNEMDKMAWKETIEKLNDENQLLSSRFEELSMQNCLLLDQIQSLGLQITHSTSQLSDSCNESNVSNMNISVGEEEIISSEKMLNIIKYLRKEKDMAVARSSTLHAEATRLKSQMVVLEKQLENAKIALNHHKDIPKSSQPLSLQADIIKKVETLNALTDSNRLLRSERDNLLNKVEVLTQSVSTFESNLPLLNQKVTELTEKCNTLESENTSLKADITRWRNKVTVLAERANKASPEDWKRLQTEREALGKMLSAEKEKVKKLGGQLANLKTDLEDNSALAQENTTLKEEQKKLNVQLETLNKELFILNEQSSKVKSELTTLLEKNQALTTQVTGNESVIADLKNKEMQIKKIAKKYKLQYEELLQKIENQTVVADSLSEETPKSSEEQLAELQNSLETEKSNAEKLKSELDSSIDREDKAKQMLKIAKTKIVKLNEDKENLTTKIEKLGENDSVVSKEAKEKDIILAQKTKEIESLKAQIDSLESQLSNLLKENVPRPQEIVKVPANDALIDSKPGAAETTQSEAESQSSSHSTQPRANSPEYMPSSSSRSSSSQDIEYGDSGPVTGESVPVVQQTLPEVSLGIPHLEPDKIASAKNRAAHSTEGSNGSVSSATTEGRPMKRTRPSEPNTTQKRLKQDISQTDDPEYEAPSSSRCDDDDDTSARSSTVDDDDDDEPLSTHATSASIYKLPGSQSQIEASSSGTDPLAIPTGSDADERVQPSIPKHYATRSNDGSSEAMGSPPVPESSPRLRSRGRGRGKNRSFQRGPNPPPII